MSTSGSDNILHTYILIPQGKSWNHHKHNYFLGEAESQDASKIVEVFVRPDGSPTREKPLVKGGRSSGKPEDLCENCREFDDWKPMRHDAATPNNSMADADAGGARKAKTTVHLAGKLRQSPSLATLPEAILQSSSLSINDNVRKVDDQQKSVRQPKVGKASKRSARLDLAEAPQQGRADLPGPSFSGIVGFDGFSDAPFGGSFDTFPAFSAPSLPPPAAVPSKKPKKRIPAALLRAHTYTDKYVPLTTLYVNDPLKDIEKVPGPRYVAKPYTAPELQAADFNAPADYSIPSFGYDLPEAQKSYIPPSDYSIPSYGFASPEPQKSYQPKSPPYQYHVPNFRPPIEAKPVEPGKPVIIQVGGQSAAGGQPHGGPPHVPYSTSNNNPVKPSFYSGPVPGGEGDGYRPPAPIEPYPQLTSYLTPDLYDREPDNYLDPNQYYEADRLDSTEDDQPSYSDGTSADFSSGLPFPFRSGSQWARGQEKKAGGEDDFRAASDSTGFFGEEGGGFAEFSLPNFPAHFGLATSESTLQERTQLFRPSESAAFKERTQLFQPFESTERRGGAR